MLDKDQAADPFRAGRALMPLCHLVPAVPLSLPLQNLFGSKAAVSDSVSQLKCIDFFFAFQPKSGAKSLNYLQILSSKLPIRHFSFQLGCQGLRIWSMPTKPAYPGRGFVSSTPLALTSLFRICKA